MSLPNVIYQKYKGSDMTEDMLNDAVALFNGNYGIWGVCPASAGYKPVAEARVKLSKNRLKAQCLLDHGDCAYVRVLMDGHLIGNALVCRWQFDGQAVCWVTQLVVDSAYRRRGLAINLLRHIRNEDDSIYGLMSSHPAACLAAAAASGEIHISAIAMQFIRQNASKILDQSPVEYVRNAILYGKLFDDADSSGAISSVDTQFFVDHTEPLDALRQFRGGSHWPLGELPQGHEFLLILEAQTYEVSLASLDRVILRESHPPIQS